MTPKTPPTISLSQDDSGYFYYTDEAGDRRYPFVSGPKRSELSPLADFGYRQLERVLAGVLGAAVKLGILYGYTISDIEDCGGCGVSPERYNGKQWGLFMRVVSHKSDKPVGYYYMAGQLCVGVGFAEGWIDDEDEEDYAEGEDCIATGYSAE